MLISSIISEFILYRMHSMISHIWLHYFNSWIHYSNSYMSFIFIDSTLHSFKFHTDRANGISPNYPFPHVILVLLKRQVLAARACNEFIIWISNMNSIYEIHMCLLDVRLLSAPTVLAPLFTCRDTLPVLCLCQISGRGCNRPTTRSRRRRSAPAALAEERLRRPGRDWVSSSCTVAGSGSLAGSGSGCLLTSQPLAAAPCQWPGRHREGPADGPATALQTAQPTTAIHSG